MFYLCPPDVNQLMRLDTLIADSWKMDGGVAFGVVPKSIWNRTGIADENNMIPIVTRLLLIRSNERTILTDAGMGNKRDEKYYRLRFRDPSFSLEKSLAALGLGFEDITDVLFTHLHDDHVGGASVEKDGNCIPAFPNAGFLVSRAQWDWAIHPNKREGASYFRDNLNPLAESGRLRLIENETELIPGLKLRIFNGHTRGQIIPFLQAGCETLVFMGDFIPTTLNIPLAFVPAVDIQPLVSMEEKADFLKEAVENKYILLFEHDAIYECCTLKNTEKGIVPDRVFTFNSLNHYRND